MKQVTTDLARESGRTVCAFFFCLVKGVFMSGPMSGIKIDDLCTMMSGPWATGILGDQGADVVKVEVPEGVAVLKKLVGSSGMVDAALCARTHARSRARSIRGSLLLRPLHRLTAVPSRNGKDPSC